MNETTGMRISMHPVVRVLGLVFLGIFLAWGDLEQLLLAFLLLALFFLFYGWNCFVSAWPMLRRMRWFFLSILMIYLFLTPGQPLFGLGDSEWLPTLEGFETGVQRLWALVMMILAVHLLLQRTAREQLISALYWLVTPLVVLGVSRERFAVRIYLVLHTVEQVQELVAKHIEDKKGRALGLKGYAQIAGGLVKAIVKKGESEPLQSVEIAIDNAPSIFQWLWLFAFVALMLMVSY